MKPTSALFFSALLLASGCTTTVDRASPSALRAAPGSTIQFTSTTEFEAAHRKVLEQMRACFERKSRYLSYSITDQKTATESEISWALASTMSYRVLSTIVLKPVEGGTKVTLYSALPTQPDPLFGPLKNWITAGTSECPGEKP